MSGSINAAIATFEKTVRGHAESVSPKVAVKLRRDLRKVRAAVPDVYDPARVNSFLLKRSAIARSLLQQHVVAKLAARMPRIDDALFKMKRHLRLVRKDRQALIAQDGLSADRQRGVHVTVPLFAYVKLFDGPMTCELGKARLERGSHDFYSYWYGTTLKVTISATLPGAIGPELRKHYREAVATYYAVVGEVMADDVAGDLMVAEPVEAPEVGAIWIPTTKSLSLKSTVVRPEPVDRDPAMVLRALGHTFLVTTWNVDAEEPFEHLLREFTAGDVAGRIQ